ncbi:MAG: peptide ABC transporter substrate-binding protein [Firmicutes bacterium]|jgi:hypothetical protein|nr:peptide ABC transporter substrate-binding protein [Bacillota bacterium]
MNISEADWRVFKEVRAAALDRFCRRILDECRTLCDDQSESAHKRYLSLYELLQQRDKEIAEAFDDFRRSTAIFALMAMRQYGLVTQAEWKRFSPDTLHWVLGDD